MKNTECKDCGTPLKGRADRKFCSDSCRSNFNNRRYAQERGNFRTIERILHKNRTLLLETWQEKGRKAFYCSELVARGFNPQFFTSLTARKDRIALRVCYDIAFSLQEETGIMQLEKIKPET